MLCAWKDNAEMIKAFIDYGIDVDIKNNRGETALMSAIEGQSLSVIQLLISNGANVNLKNQEGKTVFDYAIENYAEEGEKF